MGNAFRVPARLGYVSKKNSRMQCGPDTHRTIIKTTDYKRVPLIMSLSNYNSVVFDRCNLSDLYTCQGIAQMISESRTLRRLVISGASLNKHGAFMIIGAIGECPTLRYVDLTLNGLTHEHTDAVIRQMARCNKVDYYYLKGNASTDVTKTILISMSGKTPKDRGELYERYAQTQEDAQPVLTLIGDSVPLTHDRGTGYGLIPTYDP
jgi:hypothetical protein